MPTNPIPLALQGLGVSTAPATEAFRQWVQEHFPHWTFAEDFCDALPSAFTHVKQGDWDICYLVSEVSIMADAKISLPKSDLLPIGSLMNGDLLVIDTADTDKMAVGTLLHERASREKLLALDRRCYEPFCFPLSYAEWLNHIRLHPDDSRFS